MRSPGAAESGLACFRHLPRRESVPSTTSASRVAHAHGQRVSTLRVTANNLIGRRDRMRVEYFSQLVSQLHPGKRLLQKGDIFRQHELVAESSVGVTRHEEDTKFRAQ